MKSFFPTAHGKDLLKGDNGQALVLTAFGLMALLLMAGLGVDIGFLNYQKQQMQKAADAGAITGANVLAYGGEITTAARHDTAANGFALNPDKNIAVTVNNPPLSGAFASNNKYVEVIVAQPQPVFFLKVGHTTTVNVRARAVAALIGPAEGCIYALDPAANNTISITGGSAVNVDCGILDNSSAASAAFVSSGGGTVVEAKSIDVVGGDTVSGGATVNPTPTTGIHHFSDPLAGLPAPVSSPVSCPVASPPSYPLGNGNCSYSSSGGLKCNGTPSAHLKPGTYCGGITISGDSTTATLDSGTYVLAGGGLTVSGGANIVSNGAVTFYNTYNTSAAHGVDNPQYKPIVVSGGSSTHLSSPTSGTYQGILFFQDRTIPSKYKGSSGTQNTVSGTSGAYFEGVLYFRDTPLVYSGGSSTSTSPYTAIVADTITISGASSFADPYNSGGIEGIKVATLAE